MSDKKKIIYADDLLVAIRDDHNINGANFARIRRHIYAAPDVEAVPVVHGRWEPREDVVGFVRCSVCHDCNIYDDWADGKKWRYCPNCGAKMDGGSEDA